MDIVDQLKAYTNEEVNRECLPVLHQAAKTITKLEDTLAVLKIEIWSSRLELSLLRERMDEIKKVLSNDGSDGARLTNIAFSILNRVADTTDTARAITDEVMKDD